MKVHSIFESISGEAGGFPQGTWTTFIRLQGCNLAIENSPGCAWCDTPEAKMDNNRGIEMSASAILSRVIEFNNNHILITGGEPLYHKDLPELVDALLGLHDDIQVQVETNGSIALPSIPYVHWVVDYKCPSSRVTERMPSVASFVYNLVCMREMQTTLGVGSVTVKFVVVDDSDIDFAIETMITMQQMELVDVPLLISPSPATGPKIAEIAGRLKARGAAGVRVLDAAVFSVQIHKLLHLK